MKNTLLIFCGGGTGAILRHGLTVLLSRWAPTAAFGVLSANLLGACCMGIFYHVAAEKMLISNSLRALLAVGLLGGFTTFSSFNLELHQLLASGEIWQAMGYLVGTLAGTILCFNGGLHLAKLFV